MTTDKTKESSCTMEYFGVHHKISLLMNSQQLSFLDAMSGVMFLCKLSFAITFMSKILIDYTFSQQY